MRQVPIDMTWLTGQMQIDHAWDSTGVLDLETGDVYMLGTDMLKIDPNDSAAIEATSIFLQPMLPIAFAVQAKDPRFALVPGVPRTEELVDMAKFASTVGDAEVRENLLAALRENGPREAFYHVLRYRDAESAGWSTYYQAQSERRAREWLASLGVEPIPRPPDEMDDEFDFDTEENEQQ